jgi:hypothetical protein
MSWDEPYGLPSQDAYSGPAMWTVVWPGDVPVARHLWVAPPRLAMHPKVTNYPAGQAAVDPDSSASGERAPRTTSRTSATT